MANGKTRNIFIQISDHEDIKQLKALEQKEKEFWHGILSRDPGQNTAEELLTAVALHNLPSFLHESYNHEYNCGYKLAMNAAETLSNLHYNLAPLKLFLIKESEKVEDMKNVQIEGKSEEIKKTIIIVDEISKEISQLLLCDGFIHAIKISPEEDESEVFTKITCLKQYSSTIPNPHQIPSIYKGLLEDDKKEIYKAYTNFLYYFAGNWEIAIKRLGKIKKSFNELHKLCPILRIQMINAITSAMQIDDLESLPGDIKKSFGFVDPNSVLFFHASFIIRQINETTHEKADFDELSKNLKKIAEVLANPLKDVIQFNILFESTIRCMVLMRTLQSQGSLANTQQQMLQNMERFFEIMMKQKTSSVAEMVAIANKLAAPIIETVKKQEVEKKEESPKAFGMGF